METFEKRADEIVKQACEVLQAQTFLQLYEKHCDIGVDCGCIVDFAETEKIDLIIMGSRGLSISSGSSSQRCLTGS